MACPVSITSVSGAVDPNNPALTDITVSGTQDGCTTVRVVVEDLTRSGIGAQGVASSGSQWTVVLDGTTIKCGDAIKVTAYCVSKDGTTCAGTPVTTKLQCKSQCPTIATPVVQVAPGCNSDGTRTVTLAASVAPSGATPAMVQWQFGDGNFGQSASFSSPGTLQATHNYPPGTYTAQVDISSPSGCASATATVTVPVCPAAGCPAITNVAAAVSANCNPDGTRTVTLSATVAPAVGSATQVQWNFGDGNYSAPIQVASAGTVQNTHSYPAGSYTAQLTVYSPSGCASSTSVSISVSPCTPASCPQVTGLAAVQSPVNGCAGNGNSVTVSFSGTVAPQPPSGISCTFLWDFGDGSPQQTTATPSASYTYAAPGTYSVAVVADCGKCQEVTTLSLVIAPCCATVTGINVNVSGCAGNGTQASVTCVATTSPASATGTFTWNFGDQSPTVQTAAATATHNYAAAGSFSVSVSFQPSDASCAGSTTSTPVVVPACSGSGGKGPTSGGSSSSGGCAGLLITAIVLLLLAGILAILGVCLSALGPVAVGLDIAAAACGVIGLGLFILWTVICAAFTSCGLMETIYCLMVWIVAVIGPVATIVTGIVGGLPCAVATAITWGGWGTLLVWYGVIMDKVRCPRKRCL